MQCRKSDLSNTFIADTLIIYHRQLLLPNNKQSGSQIDDGCLYLNNTNIYEKIGEWIGPVLTKEPPLSESQLITEFDRYEA